MNYLVMLEVLTLLYGVEAFVNPNRRNIFRVGESQERRNAFKAQEITTFLHVAIEQLPIPVKLHSTKTSSSDDYDDTFGFYERDEFVEDLQMRIAKFKIFGPGIEDKPKPKDVFIILFQPDTDDEGVHTVEFPKGSSNNVILAFESMEECEVFADILKNQEFFEPQPTNIALQELESFCDPIGVEIQVVPKGTYLVPPSDTVDTLDHNPYLNQARENLENLFDLSYEPDVGNMVKRGLEFEDDFYGSWE